MSTWEEQQGSQCAWNRVCEESERETGQRGSGDINWWDLVVMVTLAFPEHLGAMGEF